MSSLEQRIARIEDEREILQTMYRYASAIDYGSEDEWLSCWSDDAQLYWSESPFCGHEQLLTAFRAHTHAPDVFHKHFVVNARITLTGETASAQSIFARLDSYSDGPQILAFGRYLDKFVRCTDGEWRFSQRRADVESMRAPPESVLRFMAAINA